MHEAPQGGVRAGDRLEGRAHGRDLRRHRPRLEHAARPRRVRHRQLPHQRGALHDDTALLAVALGDFREELLQAPPGDRIIGREIRAAEERRAVGGQEHGDRIAAQAGEPLDRRLVSLSHVGPLVAIDAHGHE